MGDTKTAMSRSCPAHVPAKCPAHVPGDWGDKTPESADDLADRLSAYGGVEHRLDIAEDVPLLWTPELVQARLVEAFDTLGRSVGRVGPKAFGSNWPDIYREQKDLWDIDASANHAKERNTVRVPPSAVLISRAEEALHWPLTYLRGTPMQSDALILFCAAGMQDDSMRGFLRKRAARGKELAIAAMARNAFRRKAIARECAERCNARLADLNSAQKNRIPMIREKAHDEFRKRVAEEGVSATSLRPSDMMPGKVMSRTRLDHYRKLGAATISRALNKAGVAVR